MMLEPTPRNIVLWLIAYAAAFAVPTGYVAYRLARLGLYRVRAAFGGLGRLQTGGRL